MNPAQEATLDVAEPDPWHRQLRLTDGRNGAMFEVVDGQNSRYGDLVSFSVWVDAVSNLWLIPRVDRHFHGFDAPARVYMTLEGRITKAGSVTWKRMITARALPRGGAGKPRATKVRAKIDAAIDSVAPLLDWFYTRLGEQMRAGEYTVRDAPLRELVARGELDGGGGGSVRRNPQKRSTGHAYLRVSDTDDPKAIGGTVYSVSNARDVVGDWLIRLEIVDRGAALVGLRASIHRGDKAITFFGYVQGDGSPKWMGASTFNRRHAYPNKGLSPKQLANALDKYGQYIDELMILHSRGITPLQGGEPYLLNGFVAPVLR